MTRKFMKLDENNFCVIENNDVTRYKLFLNDGSYSITEENGGSAKVVFNDPNESVAKQFYENFIHHLMLDDGKKYSDKKKTLAFIVAILLGGVSFGYMTYEFSKKNFENDRLSIAETAVKEKLESAKTREKLTTESSELEKTKKELQSLKDEHEKLAQKAKVLEEAMPQQIQTSRPVSTMPDELKIAKGPAPSVPLPNGQMTTGPQGEKPLSKDEMAKRAIEDARAEIQKVGHDKASQDMKDMKSVLDDLKASKSGKLPPDVVRKLPVDVAQRMREMNLVMSPEEAAAAAARNGEAELKIVRLSPDTLDRYRDKDGIYTIPEIDSWIMTNNSVSIPLPGGGDVNSPKDLESFGLKP